MSIAEAEAYVRAVLADLSASDFCETRPQQYTDKAVDADIYAVENEDGAWYVKFYMEHGRVVVVSCHPPKDRMVRANGTTVEGS